MATPNGRLAWLMASKKTGTGFADEDALIRAVQLELQKDETIADVPVLLARLGKGEAVTWRTGEKIPINALRKALRDAQRNLEQIRAASAAAHNPEPKRLEPTALAIQFCGGPNFDPSSMCPVESQITATGDCKAAVHHPSQLTIEARDGYGSPMKTGGDTFFVSIRGPARVRGRVSDNGDGTYTCTWTPTLSGWYQISISCFGISLPGSPLLYEATTPMPVSP